MRQMFYHKTNEYFFQVNVCITPLLHILLHKSEDFMTKNQMLSKQSYMAQKIFIKLFFS